MNEVHLPTGPFIAYRFGSRQALRRKNVVGLLVKVLGLCGSVTGILVTVYSLSVSLPGLSVVNFTDSRTEMLKVPDVFGKITGLSGIFTDRSAKVTDCMVCFPKQSICYHMRSESPYSRQDRYVIQTGLLC